MNKITVNGKPLEIEPGATMLSLIQGKGLIPESVVVEHNEMILNRLKWADTVLQAGDAVEIVHFVGGG